MVKLNVDAAFDSDSGSGGSRAIIRDEKRLFAAGSYSGIPFIDDAGTTEARVLRDGLILANTIGCNKIMVEVDCMEVVKVMTNGANSIESSVATYRECSLLSRNFSQIEFSHCPREANIVADLLASKAKG